MSMVFLSADRQMILVAAVLFAAIAVYFPRLGPFLKKRRIRPPHAAVALVFRLWFAVLAVASLALLFIPRPHR